MTAAALGGSPGRSVVPIKGSGGGGPDISVHYTGQQMGATIHIVVDVVDRVILRRLFRGALGRLVHFIAEFA